ncbi:mitotic checkpoint regulator, MAD2B-interacting-domain-containing protein [Irpex lacteus]|nr:mitotic checkpoint regulator, MAD2B-interacting-domain-containing protein [Irpex lacteus]
MLGVEGYGSDSDSDNETTPQPTSAAKPTVTQKKTGLSLPPPASAASSSKASFGSSLPAPKKKAPKKITIGLPELSNDNEGSDILDDQPPAKKPRIEIGGGSSSLFSMLPEPKNKNPVPERVLGGGKGRGLVFNTGVQRSQTRVTVEDAEEEHDESAPVNVAPLSGSILEDATPVPDVKPLKPAAIPFLPPSLARGKANVSTEDRPSLPKFAPPKSATKPASPLRLLLPRTAPQSSSTLPIPSVSSAPKIEEFVPPEPTHNDPYPGYYLLLLELGSVRYSVLPEVLQEWKKEYDDHVRALEKGIEKGFEGAEEGATEVNALKEMERAKVEVQEREEKKALTMGLGAALSGRAKTRHQLSTLLTDAYQNREALEEQIAMARRNRKEAGNKYGF